VERRRNVWYSGLSSRPRALQVLGYGVAALGTAATILAFLPFRDDTTAIPKVFAFLVVVVLSAWAGGLAAGVLASVAGSLAFDYFFLTPYGTFRLDRIEDIVMVFVFLGLSVLISSLLARAQDRAAAAEAAQRDLLTLLGLSRELVLNTPGPEAYEQMLRRLVRMFDLTSAVLTLHESEQYRGLGGSLTAGERGRAPGDGSPGDAPPTPEERVPLTVGGRLLGLVVLRGDREGLSASQRRIVRAFCDQMALLLERDRLLAAATEANIHRLGGHPA
jgi:two-component system sensor histidine kinase KdpD